MDHRFPVAVAMPSSFRMRVVFSIPFPASAMSKMRLTMGAVSGSGSSVGRFLAPSCTMTLL
ncbi:MAG: hypothetical protein F4Y50_05490 [Dehalococcoidia bacterium]|nr:hypothetical protein [Dehalococcoidia bacterium]